MSSVEKKLNGNVVYNGKILKLEVDEVLLSDGTKSARECVRHHGGAAVLYVESGKVLLVKQFRYLYGKEIYEIPAGKLEAGEDPQAAAMRELEEETGLKASEVSEFLKIYPTPGYTDEIIYVYLAENCVKTEKHLDVGEFVDSVFIPLEKVKEMIDSGEICDSKTVAAVYKYLCIKK